MTVFQTAMSLLKFIFNAQLLNLEEYKVKSDYKCFSWTEQNDLNQESDSDFHMLSLYYIAGVIVVK